MRAVFSLCYIFVSEIMYIEFILDPSNQISGDWRTWTPHFVVQGAKNVKQKAGHIIRESGYDKSPYDTR